MFLVFLILKENVCDVVYPLKMRKKMSHPQTLEVACSSELLAVIEALKYWPDSKATQVPEDQVKLLSDYY